MYGPECVPSPARILFLFEAARGTIVTTSGNSRRRTLDAGLYCYRREATEV